MAKLDFEITGKKTLWFHVLKFSLKTGFYPLCKLIKGRAIVRFSHGKNMKVGDIIAV